MPHFFIKTEDKKDNQIIISDSENYRHLAKALRIKRGEKLFLIDENQIQYETVVKDIDSSKIICEIEKSYPSKRDLDFDLYLAQSPLRSDAQLTIMEKATELGIRGVYPVITDNCALNKSVLSKKQENRLKKVYEKSLKNQQMKMEKSEYAQDEPIAAEAKRILDEIAMTGWTSGGHSAGYVPVFAIGAGADLFQGRIDNTEIPGKIAKAAGYTHK